MSLRARFKKAGPAEEDFELNLASIIDCFTVVITYLLFSASFISLAEMDVSAVTSGPVAAQSAPSVLLAIALDAGNSLKIQIKGNESTTINIPSKQGNWDTDALSAKLEELKQKYTVDSVVMGAGSDIKYKDVVKVLEATRKVYPKVGFTDLEVRS